MQGARILRGCGSRAPVRRTVPVVAGYAEGAVRTTDGGRPLRALCVLPLPGGPGVGQEALAFSPTGLAAAGAGAGLAAS